MHALCAAIPAGCLRDHYCVTEDAPHFFKENQDYVILNEGNGDCDNCKTLCAATAGCTGSISVGWSVACIFRLNTCLNVTVDVCVFGHTPVTTNATVAIFSEERISTCMCCRLHNVDSFHGPKNKTNAHYLLL